MRDRLKAFEEFSKQKITFNRLNYDFYDKLVEFLSYNYVHKRRKEKLLGRKPPSNTILPINKAANIFADKSNVCNPRRVSGQ
jgi:hypothetical protein